MAREFTTEIYDNEYIGDSLVTINNSFNALISLLTAVGAPGTDYTSLSTTFFLFRHLLHLKN
jgi:hypothetical protein